MSAAARTRPVRPGCSTASSRVSHSSALSVANTLVAPARTEGTPATARASRTRPACALVRTSTATSPGPSDGSSRPSSQRESAATSSATSAARSAATRSRTGPTIGSPVFQCARRPARGSTRRRNGAGRGAPTSLRVGCADSTRGTTIFSSPSAAPPKTVSRARTSGSSLRQFFVSPSRVPAVSTACR